MAQVEGKNPVYEALKGQRKIHEIFVKKGFSEDRIDEIINLAAQKGCRVNKVLDSEFEKRASTSVHQGIIAVGEDIKLWTIEELIDYAKKGEEPPLFVILDQIQDPHNMGAIIRTAYAAGAHGVIFPSDRAAGINSPVVLKSSAGAAEHLPLARVANINYTIKKLKQSGFWVAGAELQQATTFYKQDLKGSLALVVGNEGSGLRRLVKENCDFLVKIPLKRDLDSLNVSVAAGILLYEIVRQRDD
ncbi:MAG: 23S rRNA (guanosine(2251)-2'-O)-methyltransferase RlmB [Halanaerobiaceae bacterium]